MRRRAPDFRRPAQRRTLSDWIWWLLGVFSVAGLVFFVFQHLHQDPYGRSFQEMVSTPKEDLPQTSNFTRELLSSTSFARQLSDQITLAKAYIIISKEHSSLQLAWELSTEIRKCQRLLSLAAVRSKPITLEEAHPILNKLSYLIFKAQDLHYDISTIIVTLKSHAQSLEERARASIAQAAEFGRFAAKSIPKTLHCFNIKLTEEWFGNLKVKKVLEEQRSSPRLVDNNLYHFCIFSDNVLATYAVINSTVSNADLPQQFVFHVVTDQVNYVAMTTWLLTNDCRGCFISVQNIEEFFSWFNASYSPLVKQLQHSDNGDAKFQALLNYLRFYLPEILPSIERVVFLDDDVIVQKDLTPLFSLDLHGNVNGAVETCLEGFHRFYKYLNFSDTRINSKFDPQACGWAFGLNVFDLIAWKNANVTARYHHWQEQNSDGMLWRAGTLPAGLAAFYGLVEPLDRRWHVLGLGYDLDIDDRMIECAAVVHFNGIMKPWLKLAISRYRHLWNQYVNFKHPYLKDCMLH